MITEKMKNIVFHMKKEVDNNLRKYNLTTVQLLLLMYLKENRDKEIIQKDICECLSLKHSTVIEILKKLEEKGYIHKETYYKSVLTITDEGLKVIDKVGAKKGFIEDKLLEGFTKEEIDKLSVLLDRIYENTLKNL
jgi:DNA-binding MarR family transcriptional regulator